MARSLAIPVLIFFFATGLVQASELTNIIVFPLEGTTKERSLFWLNEGIAYSVSQQLESRGVDIISRKKRATVVENLDLPPGAQISHASMIRAAQRASADLLIMGTFSGTRLNLKISLKTLNLKTMSLSGEIVANGSIANLPQLENELAWMVLSNAGLAKTVTREKFQSKMRKTSNLAYEPFIESFGTSKENERISLLLKAVESNRDFQDALLELSAIYFRKGNCGAAMPFLKRIHSTGPPSQDCDFMIGSCYLQEDMTGQAVQSLSHALINSRTYEALNNLAVAYLRKGDYGLAVNTLLEAKSLAHGDSTVALNTAIVRHLQGNEWAAKHSLDEAIKAHPRDGMLHFLLGVLLQTKSERDKAATAFNKAKLLGIAVEKLQTQAPKSWARLIFDVQSS